LKYMTNYVTKAQEQSEELAKQGRGAEALARNKQIAGWMDIISARHGLCRDKALYQRVKAFGTSIPRNVGAVLALAKYLDERKNRIVHQGKKILSFGFCHCKITYEGLDRLVLVYGAEGVKESFWEKQKQSEWNTWLWFRDESGDLVYLDFACAQFGVMDSVSGCPVPPLSDDIAKIWNITDKDLTYAWLMTPSEAHQLHPGCYGSSPQSPHFADEKVVGNLIALVEKEKIEINALLKTLPADLPSQSSNSFAETYCVKHTAIQLVKHFRLFSWILSHII